jgi:2-methylcitrate dehydratase
MSKRSLSCVYADLCSAEFHSQTAVEAAQRLNIKLKEMGKSAEDIQGVVNRTHEACIRIIDKQFKPMENFADRDHCVQVHIIQSFTEQC